jgi:hypothetical protein
VLYMSLACDLVDSGRDNQRLQFACLTMILVRSPMNRVHSALFLSIVEVVRLVWSTVLQSASVILRICRLCNF